VLPSTGGIDLPRKITVESMPRSEALISSAQ
jgi:hypothetical protein